MDEFRVLLNRFWITRDENKELFYAVRRAVTTPMGGRKDDQTLGRAISELLGWNLVMNESVIKLEKVPSHAMAWMGIESFQEPLDYCMLCALLLFLTESDGRQFLLSTLTERIQAYLDETARAAGREEIKADWTRFSHRKSLVRVLLYAQQMHLVEVFDGSSEGFSADIQQEVLYYNTGLCHWFPVHFGRSIMDCRTPEDFEAVSESEVDALRLRRQRVYRQLVMCPGVFWEQNDTSGDYQYIRYQRTTIARRLDDLVGGGQLHVHRNGAFYALEDGGNSRSQFPTSQAICDIALLLCARLRQKVLDGVYERRSDDLVPLTRRDFRHELEECRKQTVRGWSKEYREKSLDKVAEELEEWMAGWMLLIVRGDTLLLTPAAGKYGGFYPKEFAAQAGKGEDSSEQMEDEPAGVR